MAEKMLTGSGYIMNEDGSLDRLGEVPNSVRQMAKDKGFTLPPDHIPAEEVDKYYPQWAGVKIPAEPVEQPAADNVRHFPRWDKKGKRPDDIT